MPELNVALANFLEAVNKDELKRRKRQKAAIQADCQTQLEEYRLQQTKKNQELVDRRLARDEIEFNRTLSEKQNEMWLSLSQKRLELSQEIFAMAEKELSDFFHSEKYKSFLLKNVRQVAGLFSSGEATVFVSPKDLPYKQEIRSAFSVPCTVLGDETIRLGGCRAESSLGNFSVDNTVQALLEQQKQTFFETSGLKLTEEL